MKKKILTIISAIYAIVSCAKEPIALDTIYANSNMNTALFFPADIRQGLVGSDNFVFSYNREKGQNLGLLKGTKGNDSNLLVITVDGKVYSFVIRYLDKLESVYRFISMSESIGHEKDALMGISSTKVIQDSVKLQEFMDNSNTYSPHVNSDLYDFDQIKRSCISLLKVHERTNLIKQKDGISLAIKNKIYHEDLVYVQFEFKNTSGIDFKIDYLRISKVSTNKNLKSSHQQIPLKPVYAYGIRELVRNGTKVRFVYVLPKFTLDETEKLQVYLKEFQSSRDITLIKPFNRKP